MKKILSALLSVALLIVLAATSSSAQDGARIHLIHGIPDTDVDVEAGGANVIEGFSFGDTEDLSALAGATLEGLKVKAAGTDTVAIDAGDVALPGSGNFTVIAHLDADGNPALAVFENDTSTTAAGQGRLTVRHAAAAPAVDVLANGAAAFSNVSNGEGGSADLDVGTISAEVVPTGATEPVVIGPADLGITDGSHLIVYAVGSLDAGNLSVLTESISGLGTAPTAVNTGNSPVGSDSGLPVLLTVFGALGLLGVAMAGARLVRSRG